MKHSEASVTHAIIYTYVVVGEVPDAHRAAEAAGRRPLHRVGKPSAEAASKHAQPSNEEGRKGEDQSHKPALSSLNATLPHRQRQRRTHHSTEFSVEFSAFCSS